MNLWRATERGGEAGGAAGGVDRVVRRVAVLGFWEGAARTLTARTDPEQGLSTGPNGHFRRVALSVLDSDRGAEAGGRLTRVGRVRTVDRSVCPFTEACATDFRARRRAPLLSMEPSP
jgi:hypothetical protein